MPKLVFAHYMPNVPIALNDLPPEDDYYTKQYLSSTGEGGIHSQYFSWMRDAPAARPIVRPLGGDWELDDMKEEIRRAKLYDVDGFSPDILNLTGSDNHRRLNKLCEAAVADGSFKILLVPDMNALINLTETQLANGLITLIQTYSCIHKAADGRVIIAPFLAQNKNNTYWTNVFTIMAQAGIGVAFMPMPTGGLSTTIMDQFDNLSVTVNGITSSTYGYGWWGARNPANTATYANVATTMRSRTGNAGKRVMPPVSYGDARPRSQIFDEQAGFNNLLDSWTGAINQCTLSDDMVQLVTWNDLVECSSFEPTRRNKGASYLVFCKRYGAQLKTGTLPTATVDSAHIIYRNQILPDAVVLNQNVPDGVAISSLTVEAITASNRPNTNELLNFYNGQRVTVAAQPAVGATTLSIQSFIPRVGPQLTLTAALTSGVARTTLPVQAVTSTNAPTAGTVLNFRNGQQATVSATAAVGATSIAINSFTPSTTFALGEQVARSSPYAYQPKESISRVNWSHNPSGGYKAMANRRYAGALRGGSPNATPTQNKIGFYTITPQVSDVKVTVGGVEYTYTTPAGTPYYREYDNAVGPKPTIVISRSGTNVLSLEGPEAVLATPIAQDASYITAYTENPPPVTGNDPGQRKAVKVQHRTDTQDRLTAFNPVLLAGEIAFSQPTVGAAPDRFRVGPGHFNDLQEFKMVAERLPDVQVFIAGGGTTWTKPTGTYAVTEVIAQGPGGGGGGGRRGAAGSVRWGGGGGGGGGRTTRTIPFSQLGATETVTVPAAGTGGAGATADSTNGANGVSASPATFGAWVRAGGGSSGSGGTATSGGGGNGGTAQFGGSVGGAGGNGAAGTASTTVTDAASGGGGGGGISAADAAFNGAGGAASSSVPFSNTTGGVVGGALPGTINQPVNSGHSAPGGGGGAASLTGAAQAGAAGGRYGGGGGGGGASVNGNNAGSGGDGGPGIILAISY